jgi:hypothetical protein
MDFNELFRPSWPWKYGQKTETLLSIASQNATHSFLLKSQLRVFYRHIIVIYQWCWGSSSILTFQYDCHSEKSPTSWMAIFLVNIQKTMERSTIFKFGKSVNQLFLWAIYTKFANWNRHYQRPNFSGEIIRAKPPCGCRSSDPDRVPRTPRPSLGRLKGNHVDVIRTA